ncbi:inositol 1,4,5-trisphosphate receptor-interacting protein-like 2 [Bufo gargarizans]|uniref:inositol 1,4,5-trisphosphate receptor-interacting protein-like 2 n=1 Tax=Bufo gargarizans TaxID=30331 RepID=UPI001CF42270|nr:inositol 1,4,5-trisphosphate receptor-interacting protein-like 2 [Bufo gargarizans]
MTAYSLNLKVFWLLVIILLTGVCCMFLALRRSSHEDDGGCQEQSLSSLQLLFKLGLVILVCYVVFRCCNYPQPKDHHLNFHHRQQQQLRRNLLETFYEQHIKLSPHVLGHSKAHVSQIVGELIKVGKAKQHDAGVIFRGDYLQIGSAYEQHKINSPDCFDILVPLKMPQSLKLEPVFAQVGKKEFMPMLGGSVLCGVAAPKKSEWVKTYKQFNDCFCLEVDRRHQLSASLILKWFHWKIQRCLNVIRYQFEERCHITLTVCDNKLILKILPRSDYVCCHISMSVRLIPAFHLGDSVYVTAQPWGSSSHQDNLNLDPYWGINFSKYEQKYLTWFKDQAPSNSCHLKCLQIMKSLRDLSSKTFQPSFTCQWRSIFCSYNLKTTLFYLLLQIPFEKWDDSFLMERIADIFMFWKECLQKEALMHFFLGNSTLPNFITLPKMFKEAQPVNLLEGYGPELLDRACFQLLNLWVQMPRILRMSSPPRNFIREALRCKHTTL